MISVGSKTRVWVGPEGGWPDATIHTWDQDGYQRDIVCVAEGQGGRVS